MAKGEKIAEPKQAERTIEIPHNWNELVKTNAPQAAAEQARIKREFQSAFAENLVCKKFEKSEIAPKYLLYKN